MSRRPPLATGALAGAACAACCAAPIVLALGVTAGLAVTALVFFGVAALAAVVSIGVGWLVARRRRSSSACQTEPADVVVAPPTRR